MLKKKLLLLILGCFQLLHLNLLANESEIPWSAGLGIGPNFSQIDAVSDDLKSSIGGAAWLSRAWDENQRLDISFDYFTFTEKIDYHALSAAYGFTFFSDMKTRPYALIGLGFGKANNFPFAVNKNQNTTHLFARVGYENLFHTSGWYIGIMLDYLAVKLDGNAAKSAYLALPLLTLKYNFGEKDSTPQSVSVAPIVKVIADSDGDGVLDDKDECPNTPLKTKVNSIGCARNVVVKKNIRVEFKTAKDVILPAFYGQLNEFGDYLTLNSDLNIVIEGHTDSDGSAKANLKLSKKRAEAVKKYLIDYKGIESSRIKAIGYGSSRPETSNSTLEGKQKNRRVIAVLN